MNLSKQLKKYRERDGFSQEKLAEKIFVSRQTISNWETEKSYPDIHNLLLLSVLFDVSLDELVKGDVDIMKEKVDRAKMDKYAWVMIIFLLLIAITTGPVVFFWGWYGLLIPGVLWGIGMYAALKIEKMKKRADIKTYAEIVAYMTNGDLEAVRKKRDKKKDTLHKLGIVCIFSLIFGLIMLLFCLPFLL